ncbi:hypothetical protein EE612_007512 [Oryza sativa]|nr:hypothetical protein EE612_007512 [Oryza sativa]KAF2953940.1 hypothetical protein DAI22_01g444300 [Oryza sativa Japonica Group]
MTGHSKLRAPEHHDHELTLTAGKESFRCDGCKEHGYHMRYVCKLGGCRAGFHLHEACAQHRFGDSYQDPFKRYSLVFHKSLPRYSPGRRSLRWMRRQREWLCVRAGHRKVAHPAQTRQGPAPLLRGAAEGDRSRGQRDEAAAHAEAQVAVLQVQARQARRQEAHLGVRLRRRRRRRCRPDPCRLRQRPLPRGVRGRAPAAAAAHKGGKAQGASGEYAERSGDRRRRRRHDPPSAADRRAGGVVAVAVDDGQPGRESVAVDHLHRWCCHHR